MRLILIIMFVAVFGLSALTGCQKAAGPAKTENAPTAASAPKADEQANPETAPRITLADAKKDFDAGNVVFIDTRAELTFRQERIKGAINLPMEAFEARYKEIPTDKKIVAYCS